MHILSPTPDGITEACEVLAQSGIVIHPTETCYGLACDLTNPKAVEKLFALKKRSTDQPVSALFSSLEEAKKYVEWSEKAEEVAKDLPGPLTLVLPLKTDVPYQLYTTPKAGSGKRPAQMNIRSDGEAMSNPTHYSLQTTHSLGIRLSSHPIAQELVQSFGKPLSTTSANISGNSPCYSSQEIEKQFGAVDDSIALLDGGELPKNPPSTVISLINGKMKYMRN